MILYAKMGNLQLSHILFCPFEWFFKILSQYFKMWVFSLRYLDFKLVLKSWNIWNICTTFQMIIVNHNWVASAPSEFGKPSVNHTPQFPPLSYWHPPTHVFHCLPGPERQWGFEFYSMRHCAISCLEEF